MTQAATDDVAAQLQVDFIAYLQRLLVEGDFAATYKFALLHALADICIERPLQGEFSANQQQVQLDGVIAIDELVEKFIDLYWQHSLPYSGKNNNQFILLQNAGLQSALINSLADFRNRGVTSLAELKKHEDWCKLMSKTRRTFKDGPLWRLQLLAGKEVCFYYPHQKSIDYIELNPGVAFCFRRFYDLVISLSRTHWTQKVSNFPTNIQLFGGQSDVSNFLFGKERNALIKVRPVLHQIQQGNCFYCKKPLKEAGEVDHFIPWARYPNDLGHNFVLAHRVCNNAKRDHLAAQQHKDRWFEQNIICNDKTITSALGQYFICESQRSEAIAAWAYQSAIQSHSLLWLSGREFEAISDTKGGIDSEQGLLDMPHE
ncbi:endonuclease [Shewanella sp. Choline-02u-19]|uniref:HNH endonuclease n=1 Tax=unclassified Shewanella TaxID=196818 RepID=UPI000C33A36A|nr:MULTISPECIES: HNH endonuclease [unclassified Shewanella]PKH58029.1 endonuclease [Shewanella sp. Bg11-22]PKI27422.1 endonuclease [Shewanella sp. Choline-02u-19]